MRKTVLIGLGTLVALAALFAACGGGGDSASNDSGSQTQNIRIGKGLTVANLSSNGSAAGNGASNESAQLALTGVGGAAPAAGDSYSSRSASTGGILGGGGDTGVSGLQANGNTTANTGLTVQGFGSATADADSAIVEFTFGNNGFGGPVEPQIKPDASGVPVPSTSAHAITEADLQPVINALTGAGVASDDIELLNQGYYDPYYASATLRATIKNINVVDSAVAAAQAAANNLSGLFLQYTNSTYTLQNCSAIEKAAMQAAVEDAHDRASILADVLNVTLGSVSGASDYTYSPYGASCSSGYYGYYPMASMPYKVGGSGQDTVQVVSNISVTYAFQ